MGTIHHYCTHGGHPSYCTHGDHPSLLHTWGPSIPIVHMGAIHPYCTHGGHPSLLYTWDHPSLLTHGNQHTFCTHGDHPTLLCTCRPSMPSIFWGHGSTMGKWWGLYCHIFSPSLLAPLTHYLLMSSLW